MTESVFYPDQLCWEKMSSVGNITFARPNRLSHGSVDSAVRHITRLEFGSPLALDGSSSYWLDGINKKINVDGEENLELSPLPSSLGGARKRHREGATSKVGEKPREGSDLEPRERVWNVRTNQLFWSGWETESCEDGLDLCVDNLVVCCRWCSQESLWDFPG